MRVGAFIFRTSFCWVGLGFTDRGLRRVELSLVGRDVVEGRLYARLIGSIVFEPPSREASLGRLPDKLREYFDGRQVEFDESVDLDGLTPFQKRVLSATREIPFGQVRSYAWVAERVGSPLACRAVGQALGRNPVGIVVPCHRVVTSQGTLGGFGWGLDLKRKLHSLEGVELKRVPRCRVAGNQDARFLG